MASLTNDTENVLLGSVYIIQGTVYLVPYLVCVLVIIRKPLIENPCFKIMAAMAICDISNILIGSFFCGICSITAFTYGDNYLLHKSVGALGNGIWYTYISLTASLAANRLANLRTDHWSQTLFGGKKAWHWIGACCLFGCLSCMFFISSFCAVVYDAALGVFLIDPRGEQFGLYTGGIVNLLIVTILPMLYYQVWRAFRLRTQALIDREMLADKVSQTSISFA